MIGFLNFAEVCTKIQIRLLASPTTKMLFLVGYSQREIIIIQDLYSASSLHGALQHEGGQYTYNADRYRRDRRALLVGACSLEGRVKWKQGVMAVGDELMGKNLNTVVKCR